MNFEERRTLLTITAYGIHSKYCKIIGKKIEKEFGTKSTFIYEYFLDRPVVRGSEKGSQNGGFQPFLLRILNEQRFVPRITMGISKMAEIEHLPFTFDNIWEFWNFYNRGSFVSDEKYTTIAKESLKAWRSRSEVRNDSWWMKYESSSGLACGNFKFSLNDLKENYLTAIQKFDEVSYIGSLKEYLTVVLPWLSLNNTKNLNIATISLSTENIYYGDVLILYPDIDTFKESEGIFINPEGKESTSIENLKRIIKNQYIPILVLYENFWEEILLREALNDSPSWESCIFLSPTFNSSNDNMEKALYQLWTKRKEFYETFSPKEKAIKRLKDNLVFSKYLIASPGMVDELKKVVVSRDFSLHKDYLPSFLVIGGAGSGKDKMARVIPLFYPEYRFGKRYTINMAALKPDFLSVPLMSGSDVELVMTNKNEKGNTSKFLLKGIFEKIWEQHKKEYPEINDPKKRDAIRTKGLMPVVILDELNSLDIDAQGALLRVLENASLQSLGGIDDEDIDFLVIGIVNEPEDVLTLHEPLQKFLTEKTVFGGVLGKALYEYFRGMRRLREDVYFRFIREGKIRLPNLSERRTDIPILFSFFLEKELPEKLKLNNIWIDFDVFEELMSDTIPWSGNFRELQSVAKRTAQFALSDPKNREVLHDLENQENQSELKGPFKVIIIKGTYQERV